MGYACWKRDLVRVAMIERRMFGLLKNDGIVVVNDEEEKM